MSKRIEFRLYMPGRNTWNGRWSGDEKNYAIVKKLSEKRSAELFRDVHTGDASWRYDFGDGWSALVKARVMPSGERKKSDGFCGYDWMVESILECGEIKPQERKRA
jgi:hypothetical protein